MNVIFKDLEYKRIYIYFRKNYITLIVEHIIFILEIIIK